MLRPCARIFVCATYPTILLVLGGTGKTGSELVKQGLERGHEVTALVRSPHKIKTEDGRLTIIQGNPLEEQTLIRALTGQDAVLSTLGHPDLKESFIVTEGAKALIAAMNVSNVTRLMIISSTLVSPGGSFLTKIPRYLTRHPLNDSAEMEKVVEQASVDWCGSRTRLQDLIGYLRMNPRR